MINAGKYKHKINIYRRTITRDNSGFPTETKTLIYSTYASVKTTRGMTIIRNDSDFEKALTNFTIRYPLITVISRDDIIEFRGKEYSIEYLNNIDEMDVELEIQAKEVTH